MAGASQESDSASQSHDALRPIDNVLIIHVHYIHSTLTSQSKHDCVPILVDTERRFLRVRGGLYPVVSHKSVFSNQEIRQLEL